MYADDFLPGHRLAGSGTPWRRSNGDQYVSREFGLTFGFTEAANGAPSFWRTDIQLTHRPFLVEVVFESENGEFPKVTKQAAGRILSSVEPERAAAALPLIRKAFEAENEGKTVAPSELLLVSLRVAAKPLEQCAYELTFAYLRPHQTLEFIVKHENSRPCNIAVRKLEHDPLRMAWLW